MMLVGMSDPGLLILPTHRLVSGFPGLTAEPCAERLAPEFEVEDDRRAATAGAARPGSRSRPAATRTCSASAPSPTAAGSPPGSAPTPRWTRSPPTTAPDWRALGVSILHELVLKHLLGGARRRPTCRYVHLLDEVLDDVAARGCDLACLVPPAGMEHVECDRVEPGEDAAEEHVLLPEAAHGPGAQPAALRPAAGAAPRCRPGLAGDTRSSPAG